MNKLQATLPHTAHTKIMPRKFHENMAQIPQKMGIYTITILYDLRGFLVDPKRMQSLNDLATSLLTGIEYVCEHPFITNKMEIVVSWLVATKDVISGANGVLGTFKIFHSYSDLRNIFVDKTIWKQHQILFKAVENASNFGVWILTNALPVSAPLIASSTGRSTIFTLASCTSLNMLKNVSGLIACVFAVIDAAVTINDMKKVSEHTKSWISIVADSSKFFVIVLSGALGVFTPGSPIWLCFLISWSVANVAKARLEIQAERACVLAIK